MSGKDVKDEKKQEGKEHGKEHGKEEKKEEKKKPEVFKKIAADVQGIVRFAGTDLDGTKKLRISLLNVKGIGQPLSLAIPRAAGIDPDATTGKLTEEQLDKIENVMKDPVSFGIPIFMLNRRLDTETNLNSHMSGSDLTLRKKFDIDFLKKIRCYKGIRHELGLPVRGQRTRSSFRTGGRVGVVKKAPVPGAAPKPGTPGGPAAAAPAAAPAKGAAPAKAAAPAAAPAKKPAEKK